MALATVRHIERLPAGVIPRDITARLRLIASTTGDEHGFVTGAYTAIGGDRIQHPDAAGMFTFTSVNPNTGTSDDVVDLPTGTRYGLSIWQNVGGRQRRIGTELVLLVQDTDVDQYTTDILSELPGSLLTSAAAAAVASEAAAREAADLLRIPYSRVTPGPEGRALVADPATDDGVRVRYPVPKGPRANCIGTSIDLGSGGDSIAGPFVPGRPSNGSWFTMLCALSAGKIEMVRNAGVGGDTLGGEGEIVGDFPIGSDHIDIRVTLGPCAPTFHESVFTAVGEAGQEGWYVETVTDLGDGVYRLTWTLGGTTTTKAHSDGDRVEWGMIGRFWRDVAPFPADILFIGGPTNNLGLPGWTAANIAAGVQVLAELGLDYDMVPVVTTICARSNLHDECDAANKAIRDLANAHGHPLADFYAATVNPATRNMLTAISYDGIHPNQEGAEGLCQTMIDEVVDPLEIRRDTRRRVQADGDTLNKVTNGTISSGDNGLTGGNYAPAGWTVKEFFSANTQQSIVAPRLVDNVKGNLVQLTATGGQGTRGQQVSIDPAGFQAGDLVYLKAFVRLFGMKPDGYCLGTVALNVTGTLGATSIGLLYQWQRNFDGGTFTTQCVVIPASLGTLTDMSVFVQLAGPALGGGPSGFGSIQAGQFTLYNLDRQEIA